MIILSVLLLSTGVASGQSILKNLGERAKKALEEKVGEKVEQAVGDVVDKVTTPKGKDAKAEKAEKPAAEAQPAAAAHADGWTCEECGKEGNTGNFCDECGAKKPGAGTAAAPSRPAPKKAETGYAKSDFVPGDEVFFDDPVENEKVGEYPSHWDFIGGEECEIITLNGEQVIKISGWHTSITPLMKEENYLPEDFTIEFDVWSKDQNGDSNNNWIDLVLLDKEGGEAIVTGLNPDYNAADPSYHVGIGCNYRTPSDDTRQAEGKGSSLVPLIQPEAWLHVAASFNKRAFKYYVAGVRMINLPNAMQPARMNLRSVSAEDNAAFYIKNVRIAKGAVPLYDRLASDGKIITYAITFETGKADLKPESMVEINRIAQLMKENPGLSFEVQGHCDSTGSDRVNDPLSQKRAEAIVAALVDLDIASSRLTPVGKGSHEPIASNSTDEGRAKNRRVEFVKK